MVPWKFGRKGSGKKVLIEWDAIKGLTRAHNLSTPAIPFMNERDIFPLAFRSMRSNGSITKIFCAMQGSNGSITEIICATQ